MPKPDDNPGLLAIAAWMLHEAMRAKTRAGMFEGWLFHMRSLNRLLPKG